MNELLDGHLWRVLGGGRILPLAWTFQGERLNRSAASVSGGISITGSFVLLGT